MRIGLLACSTDTGLGNQTWEFYKHMNPSRTLIYDLSGFNKMATHHERFNEGEVRIDPCISSHYISNENCEWLVDGSDVVFVCETPLNYYLYEYAKLKGVKVVQQYNYEFLDYFERPNLPAPTVLAAPSYWNTEIVEALKVAPVKYLPVPVNTELITPNPLKPVETFFHIIGRPTARDRNGTIEFLKAAIALGNQYNYKIFLQPPTDTRAIDYFKPVKEMLAYAEQFIKIEVIENVDNYQDIYKMGDCLVLPRKYGGLCLPAQEALAAHIPVIMTRMSPNNKVLPANWLVEVEHEGSFYAHVDIDYDRAVVEDLILCMREIALDKSYENNHRAGMLAYQLSWQVMKPKYLEFFEELLNRSTFNDLDETNHPSNIIEQVP